MSFTVEDIVEEVLEELPSLSEWSVQRIIQKINEGAAEIAAGSFPQYEGFGEICLRELEVTDTITTTSSTNNIALSNLTTYTYQKGLSWAYSSSNSLSVKVLPSVDTLKDLYPGLSNKGSVTHVAVSGTSLYYQGQGNEELTVKFFRLPTTLVPGSTIDFIPDQFVMGSLVNFVLMNVPSRFTKDLGFDPEQKYAKALYQIFRFYGPYASTPPTINNTTRGAYDYYGI